MDAKKIGIAAAAAVAVGAGVVGGAAIAAAASGDSSTERRTASTGTAAPAVDSAVASRRLRWRGLRRSRRPGHDHTPVTGAELAKVEAAVDAEDSAVTVQQCAQGPGRLLRRVRHQGRRSRDARGEQGPRDHHRTRAWAGAAAGVRGPGGPGGHHAHTPVTGAELTKVRNAVTAKYDDVTVRGVGKDPDGSYDVFGTRDGQPVMLEVSKDLKTDHREDRASRRRHWRPRRAHPGGPPPARA